MWATTPASATTASSAKTIRLIGLLLQNRCLRLGRPSVLARAPQRAHDAAPVATIEPASAVFSLGRFGSRPVERPFHKFNGIDCRPDFDAKTVNRLIHRHRQFPHQSITPLIASSTVAIICSIAASR